MTTDHCIAEMNSPGGGGIFRGIILWHCFPTELPYLLDSTFLRQHPQIFRNFLSLIWPQVGFLLLLFFSLSCHWWGWSGTSFMIWAWQQPCVSRKQVTIRLEQCIKNGYSFIGQPDLVFFSHTALKDTASLLQGVHKASFFSANLHVAPVDIPLLQLITSTKIRWILWKVDLYGIIPC